jgi:C-terminal processing protease CtpA/Prc
MKYFLGPKKRIGIGCAALAVAGLLVSAQGARAQVGSIVELMQDPNPLLGHAGGGGSQGYLGVELSDLDQEKAQALKLKEVRGAVITLIDHDAPAGQIPLKINDVVLQLNGQNVEGAEQLRRMLREIPAGRKVSLEISRDGNMLTLTVELADRRKIEADAWKKVYEGGTVFTQAPEKGFLGGDGGGVDIPGGLPPGPFFGSSLNVGALVEPLTTQMAQYMGVSSGVMVKQVAKKSEAAAAGLKAFDVILRVGTEPITNLAGWDRALRSNEGKQVQVTVLRDRRQQTLTLQVDSKRHSELEWEQVFPSESGMEVAEVNPQVEMLFGPGSETAEQMREQAEQLKDQMKDWKFDPNDAKKLSAQIRGMVNSEISEQQMQEMMKQAEQWRDAMKGEGSLLDQKQMDELKRQMEEFRKDFKPGDLKPDPKQMDELKKQMEEFKTPVPEWN